ncbi:MAG TPA: hypothetical protein VF198_05480 [Vicinamibacterales bacterium]
MEDAIVNAWEDWARAQLAARGRADAVPVFEGFARAARTLRQADWNQRADGGDAPGDTEPERRD